MTLGALACRWQRQAERGRAAGRNVAPAQTVQRLSDSSLESHRTQLTASHLCGRSLLLLQEACTAACGGSRASRQQQQGGGGQGCQQAAGLGGAQHRGKRSQTKAEAVAWLKARQKQMRT